MNNFQYVTPEEAVKLKLLYWRKQRSLEYWEKLAVQKPRKCMACGDENVWIIADCDLCFSCVTGEADASKDYEIISGKSK